MLSTGSGKEEFVELGDSVGLRLIDTIGSKTSINNHSFMPLYFAAHLGAFVLLT